MFGAAQCGTVRPAARVRMWAVFEVVFGRGHFVGLDCVMLVYDESQTAETEGAGGRAGLAGRGDPFVSFWVRDPIGALSLA